MTGMASHCLIYVNYISLLQNKISSIFQEIALKWTFTIGSTDFKCVLIFKFHVILFSRKLAGFS